MIMPNDFSAINKICEERNPLETNSLDNMYLQTYTYNKKKGNQFQNISIGKRMVLCVFPKTIWLNKSFLHDDNALQYFSYIVWREIGFLHHLLEILLLLVRKDLVTLAIGSLMLNQKVSTRKPEESYSDCSTVEGMIVIFKKEHVSVGNQRK